MTRRATAGRIAAGLGLAAALFAGGAPAEEPAERAAVALEGPPPVRGVALGLFSEDGAHDYTPQLAEIARLGASHVAIVVTWFQRDVTSTEIYRDRTRTPSDQAVRRAVRAARGQGLQVFLFPYVRVDQHLAPEDWRGTLRPADRDAWYGAYGAWIEGLARLAAEERVDIFSLGSEMSTMDVDTERWVELVRRVRAVYPGQVTYSANWDHYAAVGFWEHLDLVGLTGYFELVPPDRTDPTEDEIVHGWREWHVRLMRWQASHGRPVLLTEVGYRSNDGAAAYPWRWGAGEDRVDLEEQRTAYEAFARVWSHEERLGGVFFWNWWGEGGPSCTDYTPRGKPAAGVLERWFRAAGPAAPPPRGDAPPPDRARAPGTSPPEASRADRPPEPHPDPAP